MASCPPADLGAAARAVLERNRRGAWTCPSSDLYPHQWLWDSCFIAIGLSRVDPRRAASELRALFRGQWRNGFLPHMIFVGHLRDLGSRRIWQSRKKPLAPRDVQTSCITQPPLPAIAVERVAAALPAADRRAFLDECLPKLVAYHRWLYAERDPNRRGLVTLIHPWECGLDTTPSWMSRLRRMQMPWWLRLVLFLRLTGVVRLFRRDTKFAPANERASDDEGLRMLVLAHRAKRYHFELGRLPPDRFVLIEDVAFNALLAVANQSLLRLAEERGVTLDGRLVERFHATGAALDELWDERSAQYYSRDTVSGGLIEVPTIATFLPLWAGTPSRERTRRLVALLTTDAGFWPSFPVPSVPTDAPEFDDDRYWRGPTWVNTNWMIVQALRSCGEPRVAEQLRTRTLELVEAAGFAEYFSALTGEGYGADDFSWTAALVLDLLEPIATASSSG